MCKIQVYHRLPGHVIKGPAFGAEGQMFESKQRSVRMRSTGEQLAVEIMVRLRQKSADR